VRARAGILAALVGVGAVAAFAGGPAARADGGPAGEINAQAESYAMRVEYDIPLPAGTGTIAHVNGEARRSSAGENVHGLSGAPSELDAVVVGRYTDPQQTGHAINRPPQSECFYPGSLVDEHFGWPTDTKSATKPSPATSFAIAKCTAGPTLELHAQDAQPQSNGLIDVQGVASDALARPDHDLLASDTESRATGVSILGGLMTIKSVVARGHSVTTGKAGGAQSSAQVLLSDIAVGGQTFSIASGSVNGKEVTTLTAAGQTVPIDSPYGQQVMDAANGVLKPQGCTMAVLASPAKYPQGYIFSRPDPEIGLKADGSLASSYRGGLTLVCSMPRSVSDPTTFSPQRMQVLFGFAYTSTSVQAEIGGFNFSDIGGLDSGPILGGTLTTGSFAGVGSSPAQSLLALPGTAAVPATTGPSTAPARPPQSVLAKPAAVIPPLRMDQTLRLLLGVACVALWGALTHFGIKRFLTATTDGEA